MVDEIPGSGWYLCGIPTEPFFFFLISNCHWWQKLLLLFVIIRIMNGVPQYGISCGVGTLIKLSYFRLGVSGFFFSWVLPCRPLNPDTFCFSAFSWHACCDVVMLYIIPDPVLFVFAAVEELRDVPTAAGVTVAKRKYCWGLHSWIKKF